MTAPSAALAARVARIVGQQPVEWAPIVGGYTPAARWRVLFGGYSLFVKAATTELTAQMLRAEQRVYEVVTGSFMPRYVGGDDDGEAPIIVIEDLSGAAWPPPWDAALVDDVLEALDRVHAQRPRPPLTPGVPSAAGGWRSVAADPQDFLAVGLASAAWLETSLDALLAAEAACVVDGPALTHFDVRSDNLCRTLAGVKLVDWAEARLGNPDLDIGFWLPSLACEGGPLPESILPDAPQVAAWVSGFFAARAGLADIHDAPRVRGIQRAQLWTALPWAIRALGLAPPSSPVNV
jgi:hypothetical protein